MKQLFRNMVGVLLLFGGCKSEQTKEPARFTLMKEAGVDFTNTVTGDENFNIFSYRNYYNGGGCGVGDINNDGLPDLFFTANMGANKLFLNKGDFKFEDISRSAGIEDADKWSTGVVFVDINDDGWLDIYVCNAGYKKGMIQDNALYINNKDLTFTEKAREYGLADAGYTTHAAFFDYDLDGDLDAYILNNSFIPVNTLNYANKRDLRAKDWPVADFLKGGGDRLLRNDDGHFTDVSEEANIYGSLIGFGLGVTVGDVNNDGYPDIYVSNDFFERDYLYINQQNGKFKEELELYMQHVSHSSMGADMGDLNNDGYADIFVTEMLPDDDFRLKTTTTFEHTDIQRLKQRSGFYNQYLQNTLQINTANGKFLETAYYSGVAASDWSWGGLIFDADNDGQNDIYVCNGIYQDVTDQDFIDFFANDVIQNMVLTGRKEEVSEIINKMPSNPIANKMFRNKGDLQFEDMAKQWGLDIPSFSNGAAYGDFDNDGDLDLIVNTVNQPSLIYRNNSSQQDTSAHYLKIKLIGTKRNLFAVGAKVLLYQGNVIHSRELIPTRGFQSSVDYTLHFGLGVNYKIDSLRIVWPDRHVEMLKNIPVDTTLQFTQGAELPGFTTLEPPAHKFFKNNTPVAFKTPEEDDYQDIYNERNIPVFLSREGPANAVGDVNGDGLDDLFVGGPSGKSAHLYLQSGNGFLETDSSFWKNYASFEDVAALFFDADSDGDLDLIVGAGGNNQAAGSKLLQLRLFINDGKGRFNLSQNLLPVNTANTAVILAEDWDGDGDLDLFIGSRSVPAQYGLFPDSHLWINDGTGGFTDQTKDIAPQLLSAGMITDACLADLDGDQHNELVIVGEWMEPLLLRFQGRRFEAMKTNLMGMFGWWQSVKSLDVDKDGKDDIVLGNVGKNFYLQPDALNPVKLWIQDFNENGQKEKILTRSIDGKDLPVFTRKELTDQVPALKKQNLKHEQYASRSIQQLFSAEMISGATQRLFNFNTSIIVWNEGGGSFSIEELPIPVQLSSVNAIVSCDINKDGLPDLLMGGDKFALLPQFGRLDASYGHVLINEGRRKWAYLSGPAAGFEYRGITQSLSLLNSRRKYSVLLVPNNDKPQLFELLNNKN
ncbi:VCBS repeat-containing protein [Flavihumibacter sp. CACIAM 22H1]|uniref:VCBS repeat-containing protein n=1 Tax=Flavihumibacter sp. CACIAM 22H1 TaxID=1812911 RepID=UPI0007A8EF3C|nr:VCBS repeat-containing protein [Flavihumibacter sp. CACIAM 22H1]KYP15561.1 MAG: RNA-binding protein [Flavihumibacter sp. CACIAM 22H1]